MIGPISCHRYGRRERRIPNCSCFYSLESARLDEGKRVHAGRLDAEEIFRSYAQYFLKFLQAYAAEGVPIQAVTSQNEVDTDQDGRMPACLWGQEYEIEFVKQHLGPLLRANQISTRIWLHDHNYNLWGRVICELDDPEVRQYANAVAWHGYAATRA